MSKKISLEVKVSRVPHTALVKELALEIWLGGWDSSECASSVWTVPLSTDENRRPRQSTRALRPLGDDYAEETVPAALAESDAQKVDVEVAWEHEQKDSCVCAGVQVIRGVAVPKRAQFACVDLYALEPIGPDEAEQRILRWRRRASATVALVDKASDLLLAYHDFPDFLSPSAIEAAGKVLWGAQMLETQSYAPRRDVTTDVAFVVTNPTPDEVWNRLRSDAESYGEGGDAERLDACSPSTFKLALGTLTVRGVEGVRFALAHGVANAIKSNREAVRKAYMEYLETSVKDDDMTKHLWRNLSVARLSRMPYVTYSRCSFHVPGIVTSMRLNDARDFQADVAWWERQLRVVARRYDFSVAAENLKVQRTTSPAFAHLVACAVKGWACTQRYRADYVLRQTRSPENAFDLGDFKLHLETQNGDCEDYAHCCARSWFALSRLHTDVDVQSPLVRLAAQRANDFVPVVCYGLAHNAGEDERVTDAQLGTHAFCVCVSKRRFDAMLAQPQPQPQAQEEEEEVFVLDGVKMIDPVFDDAEVDFVSTFSYEENVRALDRRLSVDDDEAAKYARQHVAPHVLFAVAEFLERHRGKRLPVMPQHDWIATMHTPYHPESERERTLAYRPKIGGKYGVRLVDLKSAKIELEAMPMPKITMPFDAMLSLERPVARHVASRTTKEKSDDKLSMAARLFGEVPIKRDVERDGVKVAHLLRVFVWSDMFAERFPRFSERKDAQSTVNALLAALTHAKLRVECVDDGLGDLVLLYCSKF